MKGKCSPEFSEPFQQIIQVAEWQGRGRSAGVGGSSVKDTTCQCQAHSRDLQRLPLLNAVTLRPAEAQGTTESLAPLPAFSIYLLYYLNLWARCLLII